MFYNTRNSCYKCEKRHVGCHSTCEEYHKFQEKLNKIKERDSYAKLNNTDKVGYYIPRRTKS